MSAVPAPAAPSSLSDLSALLPALAATPTPRPGQRLDLPACHGSADALAVAALAARGQPLLVICAQPLDARRDALKNRRHHRQFLFAQQPESALSHKLEVLFL